MTSPILERLLARRLLDLPLVADLATIRRTLGLEGEGEQVKPDVTEWFFEWGAPLDLWGESIVLADTGAAIEIQHFVEAPDERLVFKSAATTEEAVLRINQLELLMREGTKGWKAHLKKVFESAPQDAGGSAVRFDAVGRPSLGTVRFTTSGQSGPLLRLKSSLRVGKPA